MQRLEDIEVAVTCACSTLEHAQTYYQNGVHAALVHELIGKALKTLRPFDKLDPRTSATGVKLVRYNNPYAPKPTVETEPELMAALAEGWGIVDVTEETCWAGGGGIGGPPTYTSATYWAQMRKVQP